MSRVSQLLGLAIDCRRVKEWLSEGCAEHLRTVGHKGPVVTDGCRRQSLNCQASSRDIHGVGAVRVDMRQRPFSSPSIAYYQTNYVQNSYHCLSIDEWPYNTSSAMLDRSPNCHVH